MRELVMAKVKSLVEDSQFSSTMLHPDWSGDEPVWKQNQPALEESEAKDRLFRWLETLTDDALLEKLVSLTGHGPMA